MMDFQPLEMIGDTTKPSMKLSNVLLDLLFPYRDVYQRECHWEHATLRYKTRLEYRNMMTHDLDPRRAIDAFNELHNLRDENKALQDQLQRQEQEVLRLSESLKWYADPNTYNVFTGSSHSDHDGNLYKEVVTRLILDDLGKLARKTLGIK